MERIKKEGEYENMNENLSQMVRESTPEDNGMVFSETDLDLPIEEEEAAPAETPIVEEAPAVAPANSVSLTNLTSWFDRNGSALDNINQVRVVIRGVDANKSLIMAVKNGEGVDENGNDKRTLRVFDDADETPVLDLPAVSMDVYNNGFRIIHQYNETIFVKTYGVKTGLICTLCTQVGGKLIPYHIERLKKKDTELTVVDRQGSPLPERLGQNADLETVQLLYKQSAKSIDEMSTYQTVIDWLLERQSDVTDINHHVQIDGVIISLLA